MNNKSRIILTMTGLGLVLAGLLMSSGDTGQDAEPTPEEAIAKVELILSAHQEMESTAPDEEPAQEAEYQELTELQQVFASVDLSTAPEPLPVKVDDEDYDLYINVHAEFLVWLFEEIGYTGDEIDAGNTEAIPPIITVSIPRGWAEDKTVQLKKSLFYRMILPLVLYENDAVLAERARLETYLKAQRNRAPVKAAEVEWVRDLAIKYKAMKPDADRNPNEAELEDLLTRVDMVSPSLALGQAAYESGYATSRFASAGNALFGQWDWSSDAIRPQEQRKGMGDYGIKAFEYPIDSVRAYLWNLNTHYRYAEFREVRAELRGQQTGRIRMDGVTLSNTLTAYSERGTEYIKDLQGIMRHNRLDRADGLRLLEGDPVYVD